MASPRLAFARPNGQSSLVVIFDQPMRELDAQALEDPSNPGLWSLSGGLPSVQSVSRLSPVEFELHLAGSMALGAGYTVTVAVTAESMVGEAMDPSFLSTTFSVTTPDFRFDSFAWVDTVTLDLVFSENLATIEFDEYTDVLRVEPRDLLARQIQIIGITQSGATLRVTFDAAGSAGARYTVSLTRAVFQALASAITLKLGDEAQEVYGQGAQPTIASLTATETLVEATSSEVLGTTGWPLFPGAFTLSPGDLGPEVTAGTVPSVVKFPSALLTVGDTVTFAAARTARQVVNGVSFVTQATSAVGAGTDSVGVGVTTLNKTSGAPFELVFSGGVDSLVRAGRAVETTMAITFTPSSSSYPLLAFTFLNTQVSVVIRKTATNLATLQIFRGAVAVTTESTPFDPTAAFNFDIIDGTGDNDGFFAVAVDGVVLSGAPAKSLADPLLLDVSAGATALALTLGSPTAPTAVFSVAVSAPLVSQTFLTTGLRGLESEDLLSFSGSQADAVVSVSATPTHPGGGYNSTGKPAFGVAAIYMDQVDTIQVVVGLNDDAAVQDFTGSVSLLTASEQVMDQVAFDRSYMLVSDDKEVVIEFFHPRGWAGLLIGVSVDINGTTFSAKAPVVPATMPSITAQMTQQPASWARPRVSSSVDNTNAASFGPAASILTP